MSAENPRDGARLRAERKKRGLVVADLAALFREVAPARVAAQLPTRKNIERTIRGHESGEHSVGPRYRLLYAAALEIPEDELFGDQASLPGSPWRDDTLDGAFTPDDEQRLVAASRRPARTDLAVVTSLAAVLAAQRRLEDIIGSDALLAPVREQLATVEELVRGARGSIRPKVMDVAAQWAQFAAWLNASSRRLDEAEHLYDRAIVWATEADAPDMTATAWSMKGHAAWLRGAVGPMIGLSQVAAGEGRASAGVRALAAQQEARGHAISGNADRTERGLDLAHVLTTEAAERPDQEPPWIYFFNPELLTMQRARAYLYLADRTETAVTLLKAGLAGMPAETRRSEWCAYYLGDLARAYRTLHEDTEADRILDEVETIAGQTDSSPLRHLVAGLR
ncbi:XRE family transcriptional regulator [Actinomadura roseirufa]|uniref:XRE family transcriptional regulator n=1 Tax=Actinomadura roseirufa TaxID=2094049 RepID=UPI0010419525|nr:XRE family transcriptional regulator [Actinomadura roseirufa]